VQSERRHIDGVLLLLLRIFFEHMDTFHFGQYYHQQSELKRHPDVVVPKGHDSYLLACSKIPYIAKHHFPLTANSRCTSPRTALDSLASKISQRNDRPGPSATATIIVILNGLLRAMAEAVFNFHSQGSGLLPPCRSILLASRETDDAAEEIF
jgi:hypothetical protein